MKIEYIVLRLIRHFMPPFLVRFLLRRRWIIQPGLESSNPQKAAKHYQDAFKRLDFEVTDKRILIFGYGGRFGTACALLQAGAHNIVLVEKDAPPDDRANRALLPENGTYLTLKNNRVTPREDHIALLQGDISDQKIREQVGQVYIVLSMSVYEHLENIDDITRVLAEVTQEKGIHLHFIDLRDHFFKYPFEMLTFSNTVWRNWFNPTSNLNRCRVKDYRAAFEKYFQDVQIRSLGQDLDEFMKIKHRIQPEFLSGDVQADSINQIQILASKPFRDLYENIPTHNFFRNVINP
jgi:hypothetical protein